MITPMLYIIWGQTSLAIKNFCEEFEFALALENQVDGRILTSRNRIFWGGETNQRL